jgi:AraC-like DNA-binding protein
MDRLAALFQRFSVSARMFHSGALCGLHDFSAEPGVGQLHLLQQGDVEVRHTDAKPIMVAEPSVLFYPRPMPHRFVADAEVGAQLACADIHFQHGSGHPIAHALPAFVLLPLSRIEGAAETLQLLFDEAFGQRCGRQAIVDRLFEVVLIQIVRQLMIEGASTTGMLAGMAHPQLARSLVALHERPGEAWTLETLAREAGMSRTAYAEHFRNVVGSTPGDYLGNWRLSLVQQALLQGRSLKQIAIEVGYGGEAALSRAFKARCGLSPRAWRQQHEGIGPAAYAGSEPASG